jgi:hypothetical protein
MILVVQCSSRIRIPDPDPDPDFLPVPDPGSRGQKGTGSTDPGSQIRIRNTVSIYIIIYIPYYS